jgi:hypothetical protein
VKARQSSNENPRHSISKEGNAHIRTALYMPALIAVRYNRLIKTAYGRICHKQPNEKMIGHATFLSDNNLGVGMQFPARKPEGV